VRTTGDRPAAAGADLLLVLADGAAVASGAVVIDLPAAQLHSFSHILMVGGGIAATCGAFGTMFDWDQVREPAAARPGTEPPRPSRRMNRRPHGVVQCCAPPPERLSGYLRSESVCARPRPPDQR
jgi:hypothetical protein